MQFEEMIQLLKTAEDVQEIDKLREEISEWIPKLRTMFDYDQRNSAHQFDLWMHSVHTVVGLPRDLEDGMLYLAALLHDVGKPDCQVKGKRPDDADMHYYGHPVKSKEIVETEVIPFLVEKGADLSEEDRKRLIYYVEHHDDHMSLRLKHVREHMNIPVSFETFQKLMLLEVSDALAHVQIPVVAERVQICSALSGEEGRKLYEEIVAAG